MASWRDSAFYGMRETLTEEQIEVLDAIESHTTSVIVINAKNGTGKTTLAVAMAHLRQKGLLYVINPTEEDKMGFRPGDQEEKEETYLAPLKDAMMKINQNPDKFLKRDSNPSQSKSAWAEGKSHTFVRGTNVIDTTVVIEEGQNWTRKDFKKMLTRVHDNCKVIIIGDIEQCDLPDVSMSGFPRVVEFYSNKRYAKVLSLTKNFRGIIAQDADNI